MAKRVKSESMQNIDLVGQQPAQKWPSLGRVLVSLALLVAGIGSVIGLIPDGAGGANPIEVTSGTSAATYRLVTDLAEEGPSWLHTFVELATEGTVVLLVLMLVAIWWTGRRRGAQIVAGTVLVGAGMTTAYLISEVIKVAVNEERPCRALPGVEIAVACPSVGDWSFPSNHSVIAAGLAVGLALVAPRFALLTLPLAAVAGALRVVAGVHYPHDVLAGIVLGGTVTAATVIILTPLATHLVRWLSTIRALRFLVLADAPRTAGPGPTGVGR